MEVVEAMVFLQFSSPVVAPADMQIGSSMLTSLPAHSTCRGERFDVWKLRYVYGEPVPRQFMG